ncbi:MAG: hypothetical protein JXB05_32900 [Myxococcaceae bacterium]|nr:hypothetical protein [Myxococcaceae bacterium]
MHIRSFLLLGVIGVSSTAAAFSSGATNLSGKTANTCNNCHTGGATPTVTLTGPTTVLPGSTQSYRLTITGGAAQVGGMDVSVDNAAATLIAGPGMRAVAGEVTHASAQPFKNGALSFDFSLQAPAQEGKVTLYATGNSANMDRGTYGDKSAATTLAVTVRSAPEPTPEPPQPTPVPQPTPEPQPAPEPPQPAPAPSPGNGGTTGGTPAPEPTAPGSTDPLIDDPSAEPSAGCTAAGGALAPALLLGWAAALLRRRRKARS